jgi:hypothetical protein
MRVTGARGHSRGGGQRLKDRDRCFRLDAVAALTLLRASREARGFRPGSWVRPLVGRPLWSLSHHVPECTRCHIAPFAERRHDLSEALWSIFCRVPERDGWVQAKPMSTVVERGKSDHQVSGVLQPLLFAIREVGDEQLVEQLW